MGGTYYTLETGALKVMEDFFVYANIFSVKILQIIQTYLRRYYQ